MQQTANFKKEENINDLASNNDAVNVK